MHASTPAAVAKSASFSAGISTASAEALLEQMLTKIDAICAERDKLKKAQPTQRRVLCGRSWA